MAIHKDAKLVQKISVGNGQSVVIPLWVCKCDGCNKTNIKPGALPGDVHENAWNEGWRPQPNGWYNMPMRWFCASCLEDKKVKN